MPDLDKLTKGVGVGASKDSMIEAWSTSELRGQGIRRYHKVPEKWSVKEARARSSESQA